MQGPNLKSETFTANGTWTRPDGVELVNIIAVAGGGGGVGASGTDVTFGASSGAGGGEVMVATGLICFDDLVITIGAGGSTAPTAGSATTVKFSSSNVHLLYPQGGEAGGAVAAHVTPARGETPEPYDAYTSAGVVQSYGTANAVASGEVNNMIKWVRNDFTSGFFGLGGRGGNGGETAYDGGGSGAPAGGAATAATANTGGGGGSGNSTLGVGSVGGAGGSGVVIIQWFE